MQSVFKVSRPNLIIHAGEKEFSFSEGKYHNQLTLYNEADIKTVREYAAARADFVEIYRFIEQIVEAGENDPLSDWDHKLLSRTVRR
ncbi:MAG: hypothetical protein Q4E24_10250 [bacterium]|nr:hypothetical protein [bacterium]